MGKAAAPSIILRAIRDAEVFLDFCELVPFPQDEEEAWGIGDRRDVLCDATFTYSLLALRRLHEFLDGGRRPDDLSAAVSGINLEYVLEGQKALLNSEEKTKIDKTCAHLTESGLAEAWQYDEEWLELMKSKYGILERLAEEARRLKEEGLTKC